LGTYPIAAGLHDLEIEWKEQAPELDRLLLTKRGYFPLQEEAPHIW